MLDTYTRSDKHYGYIPTATQDFNSTILPHVHALLRVGMISLPKGAGHG
jgi:hypothetical protein